MRRYITILIFGLLSTVVAQGQIKIGGNVYGGGNKGEVKGNTTVTVRTGNIGARPEGSEEPSKTPVGRVFGGARMANVGGSAYVNIDGAHASGNMVINQVYGGNDIAGMVGSNPEATKRAVPEGLTHTGTIDDTWNSYVQVSSKLKDDNPLTAADDNKSIYIGQAFGGGNGDYFYHQDGDNYYVYQSEEAYNRNESPIATSATAFTRPEIDKSCLHLHGGSIAYAYGGGNNATVRENAVICVNNPSQVVTTVEEGGNELLNDLRFKDMGTYKGLAKPESSDYQIGTLFGGNNKATMAIQPEWHLDNGKIRHLYSGGNAGDMIFEKGLLLAIKPESTVKVLNVFGGCRMADVRPMKWNETTSQYEDVKEISGKLHPPYRFPDNLAARTIIAGGHVDNVYGGNDVRGKVYFGNAVGIQTTIYGDVYGGGNGAYAYYVKPEQDLKEELLDYYYEGELNDIRPNAEQVSIQVQGTKEKPTVIQGSVYVGGNCATLVSDPAHKYLSKDYPLTELKIGSHVIIEKAFLGNNGAQMVDHEILQHYREDGKTFGSDPSAFASYMQGVSLGQIPKLVTENIENQDRNTYEPYTSYIGSLYYGGNRGSMTYSGTNTIELNEPIYIYDKLVAGCNNANVPKQENDKGVLNARYEGGILGSEEEQASEYAENRIVMNLSKVRLKPMRLIKETNQLVWNTVDANGEKTDPVTILQPDEGKTTETASDDDKTRRFIGANIYGGCYESGHVNGNVVINLNDSTMNRREVFDAYVGEEEGDNILYDYEAYDIAQRNSGVLLSEQGMDVLGKALTVYGGGKGAGTEIWGSATVNINKGYTFQVFGGSEEGAIGKGTEWVDDRKNEKTGEYEGHYIYPVEANEKYSTYVNLQGDVPGEARGSGSSANMAEAEFIYGGGFSGPIIGNTEVHLDNGCLFNLFAGSCNADIMGHTETYVGLNGFPYLRDHIYGGNDLGGEIKGSKDYSARVIDYADANKKKMLHGYDADKSAAPDVLQANSYIEYRKGSMKSIFGGCFGDYDYANEFTEAKGYSIPKLHNAFVNFRPDKPAEGLTNEVKKIFGAGEGAEGLRVGDKMQDRSYVLIDIPTDIDKKTFRQTEVFGGGSYNGLGMRYGKLADGSFETFDPNFDLDNASAIIDLIQGEIGNVYGGSYNEGVTRRTVVNVPEGSTIRMYSDEPDQDVDKDGTKTKHLKRWGNIFGGAYGTQILPPCDVYESNVNYRSNDAEVNGSIFGGNNNERRTLYTKVNIYSTVWADKEKGYLSTVYGAGKGKDTWAEHTEANLENGAKVYEVYGGGMMGHVLNAESVQQYMQLYKDGPSAQIMADDPKWNQADRWEGDAIEAAYREDWEKDWKNAWTLGVYYSPEDKDNNGYCEYDNYIGNAQTNFDRIADRPELDEKTAPLMGDKKKFNANVIINAGAEVVNYAYGGGYGKKADALSGDVYGTTYIGLLGGIVEKDIYAAGTAGGVYDLFGSKDFTASANAYIKGGTVRNVYGGGWEGSVGKHTGAINDSPAEDIPGVTHVVIGHAAGTSFTDGIPAIRRNAYGGGEGGAVYGSSYLTLNNGYVGYGYNVDDGTYPDLYEDNTQPIPNTLLKEAGCVFGGGYIDNSSVDKTHVSLYGGQVRNSVFGGGEIAAIGRGSIAKTTTGDNTTYELTGLYRPGKTLVEMYGGHVFRNVYGGGRGYDNLSRHGTLNCDGFVFGQTEVRIHGGEIGTEAGLANNDGNVFGGGDIGYVYSAYEDAEGTFYKGVKDGSRYDDGKEGYYYKHPWETGEFCTENGERILTEDCKVVIEPHSKVKESEVSFTGIKYAVGETVASEDLTYLKTNNQSLFDNGTIDNNGKVTDANGITFSRSYAKDSYVPIAALNTLKNKNDYDEDTQTGDKLRWDRLDDTGIIIHNAVFAGGNTSPGSAAAHVNATSVYGNATASIHDVYNRDLITLGTQHTGGLYGDGNLTFVDGYRELNITNYGTDYYSIKEEIDIDTYHALPDREAAYYELRYKCIKDCVDKDGTHYRAGTTEGGKETKASTITADDYFTVFKDWKCDGEDMIVKDDPSDPSDATKLIPNPDYWEENGVLPVYAGRLMNSIQRADFCGVWGSRMVMQGAQDRVPEDLDYTNYTINRVREVSLNKKLSNAGDTDDKNKLHGNYFGIYNIVNYLGALTSDVNFGDETGSDGTYNDIGTGDVRSTSNVNTSYAPRYDNQTFYGWKRDHWQERKRNNGDSHNKVALASGVYLELTAENGTGKTLYEKKWGNITGVVELDLINVQPGIGGGFVYAKNVHGVRSKTNKTQTTLTALNKGAVTQKDFAYTDPKDEEESQKEFQTSGNFVHSTQTIIDDCYNVSAKYTGEVKTDGTGAMPAHYWYIKGEVYVYDQYISAYTGIPNAYSQTVEIPLTISAASHGTMKLLNVQPNYYAYYSSPGVELKSGQKLVINDKTFYKNDPISFWDYFLLSNSEKALFLSETYVNCVPVRIDGGDLYEAGTYVMTKAKYNDFEKDGTHSYTDASGEPIKDADQNLAGKEYVFRSSNNMSHDTGYLLTYQMNNPSVWDTWYTPKNNNDGNKVNTAEYKDVDKTKYHDGPTYRLKADITKNTVLGQLTYKEGDVISENEQTAYPYSTGTKPADQADFEEAYIVTEQITYEKDDKTYHLYPGAAVSKTTGEANSGKAEPAYICTNTIQLSKTDFIYKGTKMTATEKGKFKTNYPSLATDIDKYIVQAYYCTKGGLYGGRNYEVGSNYRGLEAWSSMSEDDRAKFDFNYDALDLLIDPTYTNLASALIANKYQYDGTTDKNGDAKITADDVDNPAGYSQKQSIDYTATYNGSDTKTYNGVTLVNGKEYSREEYEKLPNEQRHYTTITVKEGKKVDNTYVVYVVHNAFQVGSSPYAVGTVIDAMTYNGLADKSDITVLTFDDPGSDDTKQTYYYCRESYQVGENGDGVAVTHQSGLGTEGYDNDGKSLTIKEGAYTIGQQVPVGLVIPSTTYTALENKQKDFTIHGVSPTETSTLFVSRGSDIYDLSQEKIITVVYQYDYEEVQASGAVTPVTERHVLNIHVNFKSGVPIVEDITKPDIILPGDIVEIGEPKVTPGAYELMGGGWTLFEKEGDAESHSNGIDINPIYDPLYWYQNDWYIAYYAKTYLGRTYSNFVPVSVANYHDLKKVMEAKQHHYYVDNPDVDRDPKIYINDYSDDEEGSKNGLDLLKSLYDLSLITTDSDEDGLVDDGDLEGHHLLNTTQVGAGKNLEFFMRTDIHHPESWTPIASGTDPCFEGTLHGDGHTISGLNNSLFGKLCGDVYNLGVTGSFTGAGIADTGKGYVENCWINTTGTPNGSVYAVFGNPSDEETTTKQIVNSYYQKGKNYKTEGGNHGLAMPKSDQAFNNGEVAYDLNGFYLYKRYNDNATPKPTASVTYKYWKPGYDIPQEGSYADKMDQGLCSSGHNGIKYVEERFADGDFRYDGGNKGIIPTPGTVDERHWTEAVNTTTNEDRWSPIWPDDYLFFGQKLTYDHVDGQPHQDTPSAIVRSDGRVVKEKGGNRVYRAPAYFRSKEMKVAHFNPYAVFAQSKKDEPAVTAYKDMTAIDFTGSNGDIDGGYQPGSVSTGSPFYPPLLDDDSLTGFLNIDLTKNLLVYTLSGTNATTTVVSSNLPEPAYAEDPTNPEYRNVAYQPTGSINGHWIVKTASGFEATRDHLLVDRNDFNAPIAYTFDGEHRMWYQRMPENYVDIAWSNGDDPVRTTKGWETVSLPFKAELVTTHQKGELTHFYQGSTIGHEYWLREFKGGNDSSDPYEANFNYPDAKSGDGMKDYANTYLWDNYYSLNGYDDKNGDDYQENDINRTYYKEERHYEGYPRVAAGTPYLIGFPGERYYEFDLSGHFDPSTTASPAPTKPDQQIITFASAAGTTIQVSDVELLADRSGYHFKPNYLNETFEANTANTYTLNADGNSFDIIPTDKSVAVSAFRPYFIKNGAGSRQTRSIVFSQHDEDLKPKAKQASGTLDSHAGHHGIVVSSTLTYAADVRIIATDGVTIRQFTIQPGETVETPIVNRGVYIVQSSDGQHVKKHAVK